MIIGGVALAGLVMAAEQSEILIRTRHNIRPAYHRTSYESACGAQIFRVRFRNGPNKNGYVEHLLVDGRPIEGAAETLQNRAARRMITGIEILDCGNDPRRPILRGTINFEPTESRRLGMRWSLAFVLAREGRKSWRMTID